MFGLFKKKAKAERRYDVTRIQYELVVMSSKLIKKQTDMFKVIKGEREEAVASNPGIVFSRNQLLEKIWGYTYYGDTRTVDTHIKRVRHVKRR